MKGLSESSCVLAICGSSSASALLLVPVLWSRIWDSPQKPDHVGSGFPLLTTKTFQ